MSGDQNYPADAGYTVWFTGLPCSGKTTLAKQLTTSLNECGHRVQEIDGDVIRQSLCSDLGYSKQDRETNIARAAFIANIASRSGAVAVVSLVSPYRSMRERARQLNSVFIEVHVRCPLEECERRDVKGMYRLARQGKIQNFTGVSDPYEEPLTPEIVVDTDKKNIEQCHQEILAYLRSRSLLLPENPFPQSALLTKAFLLARRHHQGQKRKGGAPYVTHPISVARSLHAEGCSEDIIAAGLLHDVLEDTGCEREEMIREIGPTVTDIVIQITDKDKTVDWLQRKKNYIQGLKMASKEALAVSCADKADNLRSINDDIESGKKGILSSFDTKMEKKIQNYTEIFETIKSADANCKMLPFYQKQLDRARRWLQHST